MEYSPFSFLVLLLVPSFFACEKKDDTPDFVNIVLYDKSGSPYTIYETLEIPADKILRIEAGVEMILDTGVYIIANGPVEILGTEAEPVLLNALVPGVGWKQLKAKPGSKYIRIFHTIFNDGTMTSSADTVHFDHVTFNNAQNLAWDGAMARFWNTKEFLIENNTINGINKGEGILCHDVVYPVVRNCFFNRIPDGVEYIGSSQGKIENNVFQNGGDDAIDLNNCSGIVITGNRIYDYADCGMEIGSENFGPSSNIIVSKNIIKGCRKGLIIKEASTASIQNNTFYKNETGTEFSSLGPGQGSHGQLINCIFLGNTNAFKNDAASSVLIRYCISPESFLPGNTNVQRDPQLVDPANKDFGLMPGSPCIDAGDENSPRDPDGTRADIGAIYYPQ